MNTPNKAREAAAEKHAGEGPLSIPHSKNWWRRHGSTMQAFVVSLKGKMERAMDLIAAYRGKGE
jgi:hypothetical protein